MYKKVHMRARLWCVLLLLGIAMTASAESFRIADIRVTHKAGGKSGEKGRRSNAYGVDPNAQDVGRRQAGDEEAEGESFPAGCDE